MNNHGQSISMVRTLWKSEGDFLRRVYPDTRDISQYRSPYSFDMLKIAEATVDAVRRQRAAWFPSEK